MEKQGRRFSKLNPTQGLEYCSRSRVDYSNMRLVPLDSIAKKEAISGYYKYFQRVFF